MKNVIAIIIALISISDYGLSQGLRNHDIDLNGARFTEISPAQMTDSVNLNQVDEMQWEFIQFNVTSDKLSSISSDIANCNSIRNIISTFGKIQLDISIMSYNDATTTIGGFYYAIDPVKLTVCFIYPRTDALIY